MMICETCRATTSTLFLTAARWICSRCRRAWLREQRLRHLSKEGIDENASLSWLHAS